MNIAKKWSHAATFIVLISLVAPEISNSSERCTEVVRFDERNSRLFVVCPELLDMNEDEIRNTIKAIFTKFDGPPDEYFISFFSLKELAGYKNEPCCESAISTGDWGNAYLGEYYTHSNELTLWPAIPSKGRVLKL